MFFEVNKLSIKLVHAGNGIHLSGSKELFLEYLSVYRKVS